MNITWLGDPACNKLELVGGKAANLSRLASFYQIPPGFCLTTDAFRASRMEEKPSIMMTPTIEEELQKAYEKLCAFSDGSTSVAVRSSAVDEDSGGDSFAGQHETFLNVTCFDSVKDAVRCCWESAFSDQALAYRKERSLGADDIRIAVLVQQLVNSDVAAVIFSANPITGDDEEVVINGSWGLGESIVSGTVSPDTTILRKIDFSLSSQQIGKKEVMTIRTADGTREVEVPALMQAVPALSENQNSELAELALTLEKEMGLAVDAECAYQDGRLYLLQCRPITTVSAAEKSAGTPIPTPPDFPVVWEDPEEEKLAWKFTDMHHPNPIKPLEQDIDLPLLALSKVVDHYGAQVEFKTRIINGYRYSTKIPLVADTQTALYDRRMDKNLEVAASRIEELWEHEWFPEIKRLLAVWDTFDLTASSMSDLLIHLDETTKRLYDLWVVHFLIIRPMYFAMAQFNTLYKDLFGRDETFAAMKLLQGIPNKTVETGHALYELALKAERTPAVSRVLLETPETEVVAVLKATPGVAGFLSEFESYLEEYGKRSDLWDISEVSWIEDPTPAVKSLKDYILRQDNDPRKEFARLADEREQAVQVALDSLKDYPKPVIGTFTAKLRSAQVATVLSEDHGFWIDAGGTYRMRRVFMEFGDRFTRAGVLEEADDVFFLRMVELRETATALPTLDRRELVKTRKLEHSRYKALTPPKKLGTAPPNAPDNKENARSLFIGGEPQVSDDSTIIRGYSGSPGKARGTARIISSITEAEQVQPGDVLVAVTTSPAWTPLFASVAAVVTDTGGLLSHCAVVAREYSLPAVVGTGSGSYIIQNGQTVEVDGDAGVVRILDGTAES